MYHKSQKVIQIIDYFIKVSPIIFMITLVCKFFVLKFIIVLAFSHKIKNKNKNMH